ncbi:bifunctional GMP synthase/glutamine amidotransferase protein [Flavobacteriales bacterium ALC-1]|nr:bifunctional GMP synthase/glutamine amidotransferase protein [Flavobacteriales bacterium ALC-1]
MLRQLFICGLLFFSMLSCKNETSSADTNLEVEVKNEGFAALLEKYKEEGYVLNPMVATGAGDTRYNTAFPNFLSTEYKAKKKGYYESYKAKLAEIDVESLSATEKMSLAVLNWDIDINLEAMNFKKDLMPVDQMWSKNLDFNQLASASNAQPFNTVKDYKDWTIRVDNYLIWLNATITNMKTGIKEGYVLPKPLIKKIIPQFETLAKGSIEDHLYYAPIKKIPGSFTKEERHEITKDYTSMIQNKLMPAHQKMVDFLTNDYLPKGRTTSGIDATPLGADYYNHQIKLYTTTNMTADEIHQLGLREVARIRSEMEKIKEEVGFEGDLNSFFEHVRTKKSLMPFTERSQVIAFYDSIHDVMKPQINKLFGKQPVTAFEVRRTQPFREKSAAANYSAGSLDGTRPGIFYTPIPYVESYNIFDKESLFLHEAIPGHHFQIALQQENKDLPGFRKTLWYSAYGEGWALYAESMGKELGIFKDPYLYFGMLSQEIHRAIRLVVDTGLHAKGWTREQAIQYSLENEAESERAITSEIERYMANPGQALSYKIGQLKLVELRDKASKTLGDKFDIKEYHNQVLETGCIPLQLLEDKIDVWITASQN